MSPEFFDPEKFNLKDSRQTKHSDCYALGMVIYEVLSGKVPFFRHRGPAVIGAIIRGERPGRPRGEGGIWFVDDVWTMLEDCWRPSPGDRPSIRDVLQCLEEVSKSWTPPDPQTITTGSPTRNSDASEEESTEESGASSPSRVASSQQPLRPPLKGDPNENIPPPPPTLLTIFQLLSIEFQTTRASERAGQIIIDQTWRSPRGI